MLPRAATAADDSPPTAEGLNAAIWALVNPATVAAGKASIVASPSKAAALPRLWICAGLSAATAAGVSATSAALLSELIAVPMALISALVSPAAFEPNAAS